jgi:uncharacterized lipoprotein
MSRLLWVLPVLVFAGGCHVRTLLEPDCHRTQEYQRATQVAPLKVPDGLDAPNVSGALVIPSVAVEAPPPGPKEACLDAPPRYKEPLPVKPPVAGQ